MNPFFPLVFEFHYLYYAKNKTKKTKTKYIYIYFFFEKRNNFNNLDIYAILTVNVFLFL